MSTDAATRFRQFLATVQPVVLVGGKSTRFGRDKLREPIGNSGEHLVQRPINTLRSVFGRRVKLVGECHPSILPLSDGTIADEYPGIGPMGGILSALRAWDGPIFVLAGDMPNVVPGDVLKVLRSAERAHGTSAVLAATDRTHMCAGVYFQSALPMLQRRRERGAFRLGDSLPSHATEAVPWSTASAANVNTVDELEPETTRTPATPGTVGRE